MRGRNIRQNDSSDCGVASLASIASYAGLQVSLSHLRYLSGTDSSGTTVKGLLDAGRSIGLQCDAYRANFDSLLKAPKPLIIHLKKERLLHYVVLTKLTKQGAKIMDPAVGKVVKVGIKELTKEWSGIVILFENLDGKKGLKRGFMGLSSASVDRIKGMIVENRWLYPTVAIISTLSTVTLLAITLFMRELIDSAIPASNLEEIGRVSLNLIFLAVVALVSAMGSSLFQLHCAIKSERSLTLNYTKHLSKIALPYFKSFKIGELTSRLGDISRVRSLVTDTVPRVLVTLLTLILSITILFFLSGRLAFIVVPVIPIFMLLFILHDRAQRTKMKRIMEEAGQFQSHFIENIKGIEVIRNFGMETLFLEKSSEKHLALTSVTKESATLSIGSVGAAQFLTRALSIALLWLGGVEVINGQVTIGEMVSFFTLFSMVTAPLADLASTFAQIREGVTAVERVEDILSIPYEQESRVEATKSGAVVQLKELSFGYPGREMLFEKLSFNLNRGEIVALVGASGCGKSTLVSLIMKHLTPIQGSICGAKSLSGELSNWRNNIAVVPQNPTILGENLMESIIPNRNSAIDELQLSRVVEELQLEELAARFPSGFFSHPGEGGILLSRGEQQRIAYARAILKGAPVLLLDEAMASLDTQSKNLIINSLFRIREEGGSILIITHDSSLAQIFDRVIDMEKYCLKI